MTDVVIPTSDRIAIIVESDDNTVVVPDCGSTNVVVIEGVGQQGPPGGITAANSDLIGLRWGTPTAESSNSITVPATIENFDNTSNTSSLVDVEIRVTDGATDNEPSHTATLSAADTPVGTVLAGSGTATLTIRAASGVLSVKVTETAAGYRYLWVKAGGHSRYYVRSILGVLELQFA